MSEREFGLHTDRADNLDRRVRGQHSVDDGVHQGRLADARLTFDTHGGSASGHRTVNAVEKATELGVTTHQHR
jgi:hypothetical protein